MREYICKELDDGSFDHDDNTTTQIATTLDPTHKNIYYKTNPLYLPNLQLQSVESVKVFRSLHIIKMLELNDSLAS